MIEMRPMEEADRSSEDNMILGYTKILSNCKNIPIVIWPNLSSIDNKQFLWMSEFAPVRNDVLIGWKPLP